MKKFWYVLVLLVQVIPLTLYLVYILDPFRARWYYLQNQIWAGDEPGYILFPFDSLHSMLENIRSFGLPFIIRLYLYVFPYYQYWPHFQYLCYICSVLFLCWAMIRFGFGKSVACIVASLLLWNVSFQANQPWFQFYIGLSYYNTEIFCVSFMHIMLGMLLLAVKYPNWKVQVLFAGALFFLYQIRSNVSYMALLVPFWALGFAIALKGFHVKELSHVFGRFVLTSFVPLILFALLRFFVIGQFGVSTMTGGTLVGHATYLLDETNVRILSGESRVVADAIVRHKRSLHFPCNMSPFVSQIVPEDPTVVTIEKCFGPNLMLAWDEAIKYQTGKEPFDDVIRNTEPWNFMPTLAYFYASYYRSSTDTILMNIAKPILVHEWKPYGIWIWEGGINGIVRLFRDNALNPFYIIICGIACFVQIRYRRALWQRNTRAFMFMAVTNFFVGYLLVLMFNYPFDRMFLTVTTYIFPALVMAAIPLRK